jgi:hypothetical protein
MRLARAGGVQAVRAYRTAVPLYEESIAPTRRAWLWFVAIVTITFLAIAPLVVPIAVIAWLINVVRYRASRVRIDDDYLWVGKRWVRLAALDLRTLDRAGNTWPWRAFNRRWLGANPIWTSDSVALRGIDGGQPYWVAVGTNRRDELVSVLERAVPAAQARVGPATWALPGTTLPPAGWHPDPWAPQLRQRWWDGAQWTGHTWPPTTAPPAAAPAADGGAP